MQLLHLAKKSPPSARRLAKARKAVRKLATLLERGKTNGLIEASSADAPALLLAAATHELAAL